MTRIRRRRKSWKNGHEFVTSKKRQRLNLPDARHPLQRETKTPNRFVPDMQISISFGREKKKRKEKKIGGKRGGGLAGFCGTANDRYSC